MKTSKVFYGLILATLFCLIIAGTLQVLYAIPMAPAFAVLIVLSFAFTLAPRGSFLETAAPFTKDDLVKELQDIQKGIEKKLEDKGITEKMKKELLDLVTEQTKSISDKIEAIKGLPEDVKPEDLKQMQIDLQATIKAQEMVLSKLKALGRVGTGNEISNKSFTQAFRESYEAKKDELQNFLDKKANTIEFEVKAAVTIGMDNTIEAGGSASHYSLTSFTGLVSTIRKRILRYLSKVSVGTLPVEKPYAMWIEELDEQGNPIFIGEGDAKTMLSVRYEEREAKAKKIAVYSKVTTEMLRWLPQLISYIQNNLMKRMDIKTEDQLFNGDGTGDNLKGLTQYATAFDGGVGTSGGAGLVGKVASPNIYDVLRAVALQVENSYGVPTAVYVTPDTVAQMDLQKDLEGRYLLPPFKNADGTIVANMEIVPSVAVNSLDVDFIGGDLSAVHVQFLEQARVQVGLDGNDFTTNKRTILMEQYLVQFVPANDTQVLVQGTFAAGIALLSENAIPGV